MGVGAGAIPLQKQQIARRHLFDDIFSIKHPEKCEQSRLRCTWCLGMLGKAFQASVTTQSNFQELGAMLFINVFSTFRG